MTAVRRLEEDAESVMTVTEFLRWPGDGTGRRFELVDGQLRAMAPTRDIHGTIQANLTILLGNHLRGTRCRVVVAPGVQPRVNAAYNVRIPDLGVTCAANRQEDHLVADVILLIEVLSPGNVRKTWDNIRSFTTIPSVRELLVVDSRAVRVERLTRGEDGHWPADAQVFKDGAVPLTSVDTMLTIPDIYAGTWLLKDNGEDPPPQTK
jgi:Uma2 family endonuclease